MQKDDFYVPNNVNIENIIALSKEQSMILEKRICEISELCDEAALLAVELFNSGFGIYEILGIIFEGMTFSSTQPHDGSMPRNSVILKNQLLALSSHDKAIFASLFTERLRRLGNGASEHPRLLPRHGRENRNPVGASGHPRKLQSRLRLPYRLLALRGSAEGLSQRSVIQSIKKACGKSRRPFS
jgi:hypothetical protein